MTVARVSELVASSPTGWQDAVEQGLARAATTLRGITGLEVLSLKAKVNEGRIVEFRVTMRIIFVLE